MNVVMLPSVAGGIGHISRTAALARALKRLDPSVHVDYVLDADRLRPFNIDATMRMGFRPRLMPPRTRDSRDAIVRACLGDADVDRRRRCPLPAAAAPGRAARRLGLDRDAPARRRAVHGLAADGADGRHRLGLPAYRRPPGGAGGRRRQGGADRPVPRRRGRAGAGRPRARLGSGTGDGPVDCSTRRAGSLREGRSATGCSPRVRRGRGAAPGGPPGLRLVLLAVGDPSELRGVEGVPAEPAALGEVQGVVRAGSLLGLRARGRRPGRRGDEHDARGRGAAARRRGWCPGRSGRRPCWRRGWARRGRRTCFRSAGDTGRRSRRRSGRCWPGGRAGGDGGACLLAGDRRGRGGGGGAAGARGGGTARRVPLPVPPPRAPAAPTRRGSARAGMTATL